MGFQPTLEPEAQGLLSEMQAVQNVRDQMASMRNEQFQAKNLALQIPGGQFGIGPGMLAEVASPARKGILNAYKMQLKGLASREPYINIDPKVVRQRYLELHQIPDEAINNTTHLGFEIPESPTALGSYTANVIKIPGGAEVTNGIIKLSPTKLSTQQNTTAHELTHDWTRRGVGKNLEEQVKAKTLTKVQDQYQLRNEYHNLYDVNPYEGVARDTGHYFRDVSSGGKPGFRQVPIEKMREIYSEGIQDNFKFSAFNEPGKTVRGLMGTLEEMKRSGKYNNSELKEAGKKIINEHKQYWEIK
jgi:hypothetical protein